jgi:transposase
MGWVVMRERELARVEALSRVTAGAMGLASAAAVIGVSRRQAQRLLKRFRTEGAARPHSPVPLPLGTDRDV